MNKKEVSINLEGVSLEYPVYNSSALSLKKKFLIGFSGGILKSDPNDKIILVNALNNINLEINNGDRIGLIGHNGCGKTSLLRLMSSIYFPTTGSVSISGETTSLIDINLGIDPEASGLKNLYMRAAILGIEKSNIDSVVEETIDFSGLGEFINLPFRTYSSGMQVRLAFSIATAITPEILIMDEWLSAGDKDFSEKSHKRLLKLVDNTNILILASHSKELISNVCNRVIWLDKGSVKMDGKTEDVIDKYF